MKRKLLLLLCAIMIFTSLGAPAFATELTFTDVDASTAEGEAIYKLVKAGVVNGNGDGTFTPKNGITRAELCKMINLTYKYTEKDATQFKDVKSTDWFADQVLIAKKAGYINGYEDGTFRGNKNITREEFCAIISRINGLYDLGISANVADAVSDWAVQYVNMVVTNQLMTLEDGNKFRATQPIKRGEVAVVVAKFVTEETPIVGGNTSGSNTGSSSGNTSKPSGGGGGGSRPSGGSGGSGGSSGGSGGSSGTDTKPTLTPEEIKAKNAQIVAELTSAKTSLTNNITKFGNEQGTQYKIIENVINVLGKVIGDESKYVFTKGDIYANYEDDIIKTVDMFEALDTQKGTFVNTVSTLDKETFDFLCDFFDINPDEYI